MKIIPALATVLALTSTAVAQQIVNQDRMPMPEIQPASVASGFDVYEIVALPGLNSTALDYAPTVTADGRQLYFVSDRRGGVGRHDIWRTELLGQDLASLDFSAPQPLAPPINTHLNEGVAAISADGLTMIYTACNRSDGVGDCDLYSARLVEGKWTDNRNLFTVNSADWDSQPTLSGSGDTLLFISNRVGALGGMDDADIYMSVRDKTGEWTTPMNLGESINTAYREDSPFMVPGTSTLYFSSAGRTGAGGLDFFVSTLGSDGKWSEPENLGEPFNTTADDRFLTGLPDGSLFFFTSERTTPSNVGTLDIFAARVKSGHVARAGISAPPVGSISPNANPVTTDLEIRFDKIPGTKGLVILYTADGREVLRTEGEISGRRIDVSTLPNGFYLVSFESNGVTYSTTFVRRD